MWVHRAGRGCAALLAAGEQPLQLPFLPACRSPVSAGNWFYVSSFRGIIDCPDGVLVLDTTVPGAVFVLPAPTGPQDDVWGRFKVQTKGALAPPTVLFDGTRAAG